MKWLAILNPAAHNGAGLTHLRFLARTLHQEFGAECAWSTHPRHAREIAQNSEPFDGLIAVGGDGTIYEVVNGMNLQTQCLGIIPAGTGNGLAHELGVLNIFSGLQQLQQPRLAPLDLIQSRFRVGQIWQERYIVHTSALGYLAEVVAFGMGPLKRFGYLRYALAACVQAPRQQPFAARLRIDDCDEQECLLTNLTVNNSRYAGPFCLFPEARLQDGRLDLLYGRNSPPDQFLEDLGIVTQTYFRERSLRNQARTVSVDLARPMTLMLDGELIPQVDAVRFHVIKGRLRCVAGGVSRLKLLDEPHDRSPFSEDTDDAPEALPVLKRARITVPTRIAASPTIRALNRKLC